MLNKNQEQSLEIYALIYRIQLAELCHLCPTSAPNWCSYNCLILIICYILGLFHRLQYLRKFSQQFCDVSDVYSLQSDAPAQFLFSCCKINKTLRVSKLSSDSALPFYLLYIPYSVTDNDQMSAMNVWLELFQQSVNILCESLKGAENVPETVTKFTFIHTNVNRQVWMYESFPQHVQGKECVFRCFMSSVCV